MKVSVSMGGAAVRLDEVQVTVFFVAGVNNTSVKQTGEWLFNTRGQRVCCGFRADRQQATGCTVTVTR